MQGGKVFILNINQERLKGEQNWLWESLEIKKRETPSLIGKDAWHEADK